MSEKTKTANSDMDQLMEHVQALMAATADVAGEKVMEARKRVPRLPSMTGAHAAISRRWC